MRKLKMMNISAFGDEAAIDFEEQLQVLRNLDISHIDIRAAWGVNCAQFSAEHAARIKQLCEQYGVAAACMGSPIGKSPIADPIEIECERLKAIGETAHQLGTRNIRLFSFYPEGEPDDTALRQSVDRLGTLTRIAAAADLQLLLENEKGLVGDVPARCLRIMRAIDSPHFRFIWDPANFVQCGAAEQVEQWWDALSPHIGYIHIKDALLSDGSVTVAGRRRWPAATIADAPARWRLPRRALSGAASARSAAFQRLQRRGGHGPGGRRTARADGGGRD